MSRCHPITLLLVLAPALAAQDTVEDGWIDLFDGRTLDGWVQRGGKARYEVQGGVLVGTSVPNTPNSFLCTEREFGDFVLTYEFLVDPRLNSGVQIRSLSRPDVQNGRVHGYQVEIDPSERAWTGGLYDEGRRGWLDDLADDETARRAFRQNEWNTVRVEAVGAHIRTWVNGVPAADHVDSLTLSGFIGLQVHGVGRETEPRTVRWRNLRLRDLGRHVWRPLWNGVDLTGWRILPGGSWTVVDGRLEGRHAADDPRHGILLGDAVFEDFVARIEYRALRGNSGFYFRCEPVDGNVQVHGFQAEIDPVRETAKLYETGGRGNVAVPSPEFVAKWTRAEPDAWNRLTVSALGRRIAVHLNDRLAVELRDDPGRRRGRLGVQLHGGQDVRIDVRAIEVLVPEPR